MLYYITTITVVQTVLYILLVCFMHFKGACLHHFCISFIFSKVTLESWAHREMIGCFWLMAIVQTPWNRIASWLIQKGEGTALSLLDHSPHSCFLVPGKIFQLEAITLQVFADLWSRLYLCWVWKYNTLFLWNTVKQHNHEHLNSTKINNLFKMVFWLHD